MEERGMRRVSLLYIYIAGRVELTAYLLSLDMASPTLTEIRQAQAADINNLLRYLSEAQATAKMMITEREKGRATASKLNVLAT
jgi:hypothetical protein